jgi:peroxiredoxin
MSTPLVQGDLNQFPAQEVLKRIVQDSLEGILHFRFPNETLNTKIIVGSQRLGGIISPFIPQWGNMLVPFFMNSETYERALLGNPDAVGALRNLEKQGVLPSSKLETILNVRATMGLLPILGRTDGRFLFAQRDTQRDFLEPGIKIAGLLEQLQNRKQVKLDPTTTYQIFEQNIQNHNDLDVVSLEVLAALANELSLLEVAQRTRMVWDELAVIIQRLEAGGIIRAKGLAEAPKNLEVKSTPEKIKPTKRIRKRLIPGDMAPDFVLPGLGGTKVRLSDYRGKRVLIRFNRQAGCPICNPRNREFIRLYPHFQEANTEIIGIFGSPEDVMPLGIGMQNPPYPVLADPKDTTYAEYGVERSLWGMLTPQNWKNMAGIIEGSKMESFRAAGEGEATRMPAEFLIDEHGRIEHVHYHAFATDFLPLDVLFSDWLKIKS